MTISDARVRILCQFLLSLILFFTSAKAKYLWPLPASTELTSNFCAYRGGHYHAGIDIRTFGKTGYDVLAVEDGYLWRVAANWWGYGKVVYLKMDNGEIEVCAHLSEFTPEVEMYVRKHQRDAGRYKVNLFPEKDLFRFKKGEVIGKTGQTGVGAPHLHFEIRTADNEAVQPLKYYREIKDNRAPRFREITFRPMGSGGRVNGSYLPHSIKFRYSKTSNDYSFSEIPIISGNVGVEIKVVDRRNRVERNYNIARLKFYLNDKLVFQTAYDTLSFNTWGKLNFDYNMYQRINGDRYYHNLYFPDGKHSPMQNHNAAAGECLEMPLNQKTKPGLYQARVLATDASGNERIAHFELRIVPDIKLYYPTDDIAMHQSATEGIDGTGLASRYNDDIFTLNVSRYNPNLDNFERIGIVKSSIKLKDTGQLIRTQEIIDLAKSEDSTYALLRLDYMIGDKPVQSYLMGLNSGYRGKILMPDLIDDVDFIRAVDFIASYPIIEIDLKSFFNYLSRNEFNANFFQPINPGSSIKFASKLKRPIMESCIGSGFTPLPDYLAIVKLLTDGYHLKYPGVRKDYEIAGQKLSLSGKNKSQFLFRLEYINDDLIVSPDNRLLQNSMRIRMKLPDSFPEKKTAIYGISREGKPSFMGNGIDTSGYITALAKSFGTYRLIVDSIPPEISNVKPGNGLTVNTSEPVISFTMKDDLSGFNSDTLLIVKLDGEYLVSEYDVDNKIVHSYINGSLKAGRHELTIFAMDRMGNKSYRKSTFIYNQSQKK